MNLSNSNKDIWTIKRILSWTSNYLESKGCDTPRLDAEVLLGFCLQLTRVELYLNFERPLSNAERDCYRGLILRRVTREPVSLIIGKREFWSLPFKVTRGVLIPRPDTETLVEVALHELTRLTNPFVLEIGVGSGAISISILRENASAVVLGSDVNRLAIDLAIQNARDLGCSDRFIPVMTDLMGSFKEGQTFDMICSNPPYIPSLTIPDLAPEIVNFDPASALDGGSDGLEIIRKIIHETPKYLSREGCLILEIGDGQSDSVTSIIELEGKYSGTSCHRDLSGKVRVIKAQVQ